MYISLIDKIVFINLFANLHGLGHDNYNDVSSKLISSNHYNNRLSTADGSKSNRTDRGSFNIVIRMIAIGFPGSDNNENSSEQQRPISSDLSMRNKKTSLHPMLHKGPGYLEDKKIQLSPTTSRFVLLPLMISMLLERIKQRTENDQKSENLRKSYEIDDELYAEKQSENKQHTFYNTLKELTKTNVDQTKAEKATFLLFSILSCVLFLITTFLIIRRLQGPNKYNIVRVGSSSSHGQRKHEETAVKLLP